MSYSFERNHSNSGWTARAASNEIYKIVERNQKGYVHSIFNNSFNLAFGDSLIHIGDVEKGISPFGIGLNKQDVQQFIREIRGNQNVVWHRHSETFVFSEGPSLSIGQAELANPVLYGFMYNLWHLKDNLLFVADRLLQEDWQTGLAQTNNDKIMLIKFLTDPIFNQKDHPILHELDNLKMLARGDQSTDANNVFNYWIGRGLGLTPSGDDVITGICAIFSALEGTNDVFQQQLKTYLFEYGRKRTTHISLEYLLYAAENKFHSHLIQMCQVMDKPRGTEFMTALEEMRKIGHTSGADTVIGVLLGIKALAF
ncbi:hypothetical protein A8F94_13350 [Bacillus sp. FJAT-27225]|uniref:DUF2877 domain-containing protein n=1 Tax=Bacillus sp. FJAT-27225 TaxID=1743144 RepID=UPI00080C20D1|nr:DUF2877 domain-containing protein [Bacillus sp. FJAT-27225]OCA85847.1 hypothetical protein A8F94_13350 [Bacillus sp. FJAT-27225]